MNFIDNIAANLVAKSKNAQKILAKKLNFNISHTSISKNLVDAIGNALPDMMWAKALDGKYLWANDKIINELLFSDTLENTVGRTDIEMSSERINIIGKENHTFGMVCGDSDSLVIRNEKPQRFLEFGLVTGKPMFLEVHKDVLRNDDGVIIGTVGTGRNVTNEYIELKNITKKLKNGEPIENVIEELNTILDKYYYETES